MIEMFLVTIWDKPKIKKVEVVKETEHFIVLPKVIDNYSGLLFEGKERRVSKHNNYEHYFHTWKEAHDYLKQTAEYRLASAKNALCSAEKFFAEINELEEE